MNTKDTHTKDRTHGRSASLTPIFRWVLPLLVLGAAVPCLQAQTTESYTFTTNRVVPDGNAAGLADVRNVNSAIGVITSVKVRLKLTGEFNGDLYGYVRHSSGLTVLLNRPGKTAANSYGYPDSGLDVTFQTGAGNGDIHLSRNVITPPDGSPLTGTWEPDGRAVDPAGATDASSRSSSLTNFNGLNAAGSWTLYLADIESGGTNMLTEWGLDITGAAYPTLAWSNPADIVYGTALSGAQLNATATHNSTNVPGTFTYTPPAGTVLNAGAGQTLSVTFTPADSAGYLSIGTNVTINVLQAPLTITANDTNAIYGSALPTFTASYSGFVNGDTPASLDTPVTLSTLATSGSPVGTYTITASGAADANYIITHVNGTLTITPAALTITANNTNAVYGAPLPTFTASYSGFVNGDTPASLDTPVTLSTLATAGSPVGTYTITASGAADANYIITHVNGTLTITPAGLTVTANNTNSVYGSPLPTFTASYNGFVNGDTPASLDTPVTLSTAATNGSPVRTYTIIASGAADANYIITHVNGTLTITPAALTITANNTNAVYGSALPTFTASYSGFVNGDTPASLDTPVSLTTLATSGSPVGTYTITASGAADANYIITHVNGTLTITPAALTITANNTNAVYGTALPTFTASYSGFVNGDTPASLDTPLTLSTTATNGSPVGTYTITASGAADANYTITHVNGALTITPAVITVTANDKTKAYGAALPPLTATYSGFAAGDGTNNLTALATLATTATAASNVGTYPITASSAASPNYTFNYVAGTLTITQSLTFGVVVSSANPALPGTSVAFTATLGAVAPGAGTPSGTVNFRIDGTIRGSATLFGGSATLLTNGLALGSHTVVAEYAGNVNFTGTTNSLTPDQVINTPPVAGDDTIERYPTQGVKVRLATLLGNDSDADSDTLTPTISATSANGGTITVAGAWVFYTPAAGFTNEDSFTYTISDGRGGSVVGTVTVAIKVDTEVGQNLLVTDLGNGSFSVRGSGIPGRTYRLQYTDTLTPANWLDLAGGLVTADGTGQFSFTDTAGSSSRSYRSEYP